MLEYQKEYQLNMPEGGEASKNANETATRKESQLPHTRDSLHLTNRLLSVWASFPQPPPGVLLMTN